MNKVYIYGTGSKAVKFLPAILLNYHVLGFIDSDQAKHNTSLLGMCISHISKISLNNNESILIASSYTDEINNMLVELGLPKALSVDEIPSLINHYNQYSDLQSYYREQLCSRIPKTPLLEKHLHKTELITNRLDLLELLPKNGDVAELGVANGDYTAEILRLNKPNKLHLIDVWHSERYNETLFNNVCSTFSQQIEAQQVQIHRKLSYLAADDFPDQYFDWVYIDTSHCYEGTKKELEAYACKIKEGGYIAGHDYTMGNWNKQFRYGVMEAVHEFCVKYDWKIKYLTMDLSEGQSFVIKKIDEESN